MYQISLIHPVEVDIWTKVVQTLNEQCPSDTPLMSLENKSNYVRSSESQKASLIYSHIALLIFIIYYYFIISWETMFFLDHWEYWECRGSKMFLYAEGVQWGVDIGTLSGHAYEQPMNLSWHQTEWLSFSQLWNAAQAFPIFQESLSVVLFQSTAGIVFKTTTRGRTGLT